MSLFRIINIYLATKILILIRVPSVKSFSLLALVRFSSYLMEYYSPHEEEGAGSRWIVFFYFYSHVTKVKDLVYLDD